MDFTERFAWSYEAQQRELGHKRNNFWLAKLCWFGACVVTNLPNVPTYIELLKMDAYGSFFTLVIILFVFRVFIGLMYCGISQWALMFLGGGKLNHDRDRAFFRWAMIGMWTYVSRQVFDDGMLVAAANFAFVVAFYYLVACNPMPPGWKLPEKAKETTKDSSPAKPILVPFR